MDAALVRHIAGLSRLTMSEEEAGRFAEELSRIVGYVEQLSQGDPGTGEVPAATPAPLREDLVVEPSPERLLGESAGRFGRFVKVPVVVGEAE